MKQLYEFYADNEKLSETIKNFPWETESIFWGTYPLNFLNLPDRHSEKDLQKAILTSIKKFILELGGSFVFKWP